MVSLGGCVAAIGYAFVDEVALFRRKTTEYAYAWPRHLNLAIGVVGLDKRWGYLHTVGWGLASMSDVKEVDGGCKPGWCQVNQYKTRWEAQYLATSVV